MLVDGDHAEGEAGEDAQGGGEGGAELEFEAEDENGGSDEGGGGVDVGAEDVGDLGEEDVADGATAYSGDSAEEDGEEWVDAEVEGLGCSGDGEEAEARGVEGDEGPVGYLADVV